MIRELTWDSAFFKKKIGELRIADRTPGEVDGALRKAGAEGFQYIICKMKSHDTGLIRTLESSGFYLSDVGITSSVRTAEFPFGEVKNRPRGKGVAVATNEDIPMLKALSTALFLDSRFYHDPFFSRREADGLYQTWIENSVKGQAADIVFHIPKKGFVTCRKSGRSGEIVLIGIKEAFRGKGLGAALVEEAMKWFRKQALKSVSVRTQLRNVGAMNFYLKMGFSIREYDIILAKML